MVTKLDNRQSRQRALLDQLVETTDVKLDTLLNLINDELQPPLRLRQSDPTTPSRVVNLDAASVTTKDGSDGHGRTKSIRPINGVLPSFTPGSFTIPSIPGNPFTASGITLATTYNLPTMAANEWLKILVALNSDGQVVLTFGSTGISESTASLPDADAGTLPIGYVSINTDASIIVNNVDGSRIYQFTGGSADSVVSGTFKNYMSRWFDGESNISGVNNGGVSDTGNRSVSTDAVWASTNTANITIQRSSVTPLRGKNSILVNAISANSSGTIFIETPTFTLDSPELDIYANTLSLYVYFVFSASLSGVFDIVLVRYDSSGVYQEKIPIYGVQSNSVATPPSQLINTNTSVKKYHGYSSRVVTTTLNSTDKYALRIRAIGSAANIRIEDLYVGPSSDVNGGGQRFVGRKEFADTVQLREGMNVQQDLDFETTLTVTNEETKIVGKLNIANGKIISVDAGANLVTVGSITGTGTLSGSGTITSI